MVWSLTTIRHFGGFLILAALSATAQAGSVTLAWNPSASPTVAGYRVYYGDASGDYSANMDAGANLAAVIGGLTPGQTYYFAALAYEANGDESVFSNEVTNTLPESPDIIQQPLSQAAIAGAPVTLSVGVTGEPPLSYQWMNGLASIAGATNPVINWPQIVDGDAGNYTVVVSNLLGCATSSVAMLTVIDRPVIVTQPQSQTVIASATATFSCAFVGAAPLSIQWCFGTTAITGATTGVLVLAGVTASNAGSYVCAVSNAAGAVTSSVATLTVIPATIASAAGSYNGLFFQTNADGTPDVSEATAGFLGNCVVSCNGAFSAKVYVGGGSWPVTGIFDSGGNASATIPRAGVTTLNSGGILSGAGLSNLAVVLHLDLINGTKQMTGTISSADGAGEWTSFLVADLATNAFPNLTAVKLAIVPGLSADFPAQYGVAKGLVSASVLSLFGQLPDEAAISQTVPISKDGNVPIYVSLYNNSGLLEGWINLAGGAPSGSLAWIRPPGVVMPPGYPAGFDTVVKVEGTTSSQ